jgi:hypothetical protein
MASASADFGVDSSFDGPRPILSSKSNIFSLIGSYIGSVIG